MTELEVKLSANIKDLEDNLKRAKKSLDEFGDVADKGGKKGAKGFKTVGKGAANAVPAVTEFSRVIQDAPFGIQGVANNIQQLTSNFGYLVTSAGGAKNALKLMVSSLAGPAGVLLAVSVVTSALTYFANEGLGKSLTATEKLAKAQKDLAKGLDDYRESLSGVNKARLEGNRSAAEELVKLRLLKNQIEDTNLSQEERKDGIKKLRKEFPAYFQDVRDEGLLNGTLQGTYDKLTTSIIKRAKATAVSNLLIENARKEITVNQQLDDINSKIAANDRERGKARDKFNKSTQQAYLFGINPAAKGYTEEVSKVNNLLEEQTKLQGQLGTIGAEAARLTANIEVDVEPEIKLKIDTDKLKSEFGKYKFGDAFLAEAFAITPEAQGLLQQKALDAGLKIGSGINQGLQDGAKPIKAYLSEIEKFMIEFDTNLGILIEGSLSDTFKQLGAAIGESLIQGGNVFAAIGQTIIAGIGSFLSKMGGLLIEYGTLAVLKGKLDLAILAGGPVAIGAGLAAIAAGIAISAIGSAFSSAASGGAAGVTGFSGSASSVAGQGTGGNISNSGSNFGASNSSGGTVVFEIQGQKLVGVLNRTLGANARLGGNLSLG